MKDKTLFTLTLPYMRKVYRDDMLNQRKKDDYLKLVHENNKKKPNYLVVRQIPEKYREHALLLKWPKIIDFLFAVILLIVFIFLHIRKPEFKNIISGIFLQCGIAYGIIIALTVNLNVESPCFRSISHLIDRKSFLQSLFNILNTAGTWVFISAFLYGLSGLIIQGYNEKLLTLTVLGSVFFIIFYKTRYIF